MDKDRAQRWRQVTGPASAIIHMLSEIGWDMPSPEVWRDDQGQLWAWNDFPGGATKGDYRELVKNVEGTVWRQHWREAAKGFAGGGIDGAMDLSHVRKEIRRWQIVEAKGEEPRLGQEVRGEGQGEGIQGARQGERYWIETCSRGS